MQVEAKFPRDVIKKGFQYEILDDGDVWMDMLNKRNLMAHTYDETKAKKAFDLIVAEYYQQLKKLQRFLSEKQNEQ